MDDVFSPARPRSKSVDQLGGILSPSSSRSTVSLGDLISRPSAVSELSIVADEDELEMRLDSLHFDSLHFDPDEIMNSL